MIDINESNFEQYFHDVRKRPKPQKGEVLAQWRATADFVDGWVKRNVLEMLATNKVGASSARKVMRNLVGAVDRDGVRVLREMTEDLLNGMSLDTILNKPYRMVIEQFYWTMKEYVPDNPHWRIIKSYDLTEGQSLTEVKIEL